VADGPHAGLSGIQSAVGSYELDSESPTRQKVRIADRRILSMAGSTFSIVHVQKDQAYPMYGWVHISYCPCPIRPGVFRSFQVMGSNGNKVMSNGNGIYASRGFEVFDLGSRG
jgi:hypothetical protein